jgi:Skp family chaperone for outer membrane proteins
VTKIRNYWLSLPIGSKMKAFILLLLLVVLIAAGFNMYTIQFSVVDVNEILEEISKCENAQDAMKNEEAAFQVFVRSPS